MSPVFCQVSPVHFWGVCPQLLSPVFAPFFLDLPFHTFIYLYMFYDDKGIKNPRFRRGNRLYSGTEREGFEPSKPCGLQVFETCCFNHSHTSPNCARAEWRTAKRLYILYQTFLLAVAGWSGGVLCLRLRFLRRI